MTPFGLGHAKKTGPAASSQEDCAAGPVAVHRIEKIGA
jgi:hypothetical protein